MKFKQMVKNCTPKSITEYWSDQYNFDHNVKLVIDLINRLLNKKLLPSDGILKIEQGESFFAPDKKTLFVHFVEDGDIHGIEFMPWGQILNTEVEFEQIDKNVVVASILYEMTWEGLYEADVKESLRKLKAEIEKIEKGEVELFDYPAQRR